MRYLWSKRRGHSSGMAIFSPYHKFSRGRYGQSGDEVGIQKRSALGISGFAACHGAHWQHYRCATISGATLTTTTANSAAPATGSPSASRVSRLRSICPNRLARLDVLLIGRGAKILVARPIDLALLALLLSFIVMAVTQGVTQLRFGPRNGYFLGLTLALAPLGTWIDRFIRRRMEGLASGGFLTADAVHPRRVLAYRLTVHCAAMVVLGIPVATMVTLLSERPIASSLAGMSAYAAGVAWPFKEIPRAVSFLHWRHRRPASLKGLTNGQLLDLVVRRQLKLPWAARRAIPVLFVAGGLLGVIQSVAAQCGWHWAVYTVYGVLAAAMMLLSRRDADVARMMSIAGVPTARASLYSCAALLALVAGTFVGELTSNSFGAIMRDALVLSFSGALMANMLLRLWRLPRMSVRVADLMTIMDLAVCGVLALIGVIPALGYVAAQLVLQYRAARRHLWILQ